MTFDDTEPVRPDGLSVRRRRHDRGWSTRDLVDAIGDACERATGIRQTITPNQLKAVEEHCERIPYATLCLVADGLGCDPVDLLPTEMTTEIENEDEQLTH
jgi:hypothetical protein